MIETASSGRQGNGAPDGIAIIGMGCRLPGDVDSPEAFWQLLCHGVDAIRDVPADRKSWQQYFNRDPTAAGKAHLRRAGFISAVDRFDASFFGIAPREAAAIDPQQRLLLEVAWESLEDAGLPPNHLRGSETGLFVGMSSDDFAANHARSAGVPSAGTYTTLGIARSLAAGRIAYFLDFHGPVIQLDTSCSSSLVAVQQACQSLSTGQCNLALAGGVNLNLSAATTAALCQLTVLAPDGRCKTFDAAADGYVRGEGCGMVVLKRQADALRDGDHILAVIRAATINHDGASETLTTPSAAAQQRLMRNALRQAGLDGASVSFIESHGTGTRIGDPIEMEAIEAVYGRATGRAHPLLVGAVKTNIGHLEAAAGIAGLLKVVLALQHGQIPPNLHFTNPNPEIPWSEISVRVPCELTAWPGGTGRPYAAVSALGISGTNAHLILEGVARAPREKADDRADAVPGPDVAAKPTAELNLPRTRAPAGQPPLHLLPLSTHAMPALRELAAKYARHLAAHPEQSLDEICFTAATGRNTFDFRVAVIGASREEMLAGLQAVATGDASPTTVVGGRRQDGRPAAGPAFLFTGQGTQYPGMGQALFEGHAVFRDAIQRCDAILRDRDGTSLINLLYGKHAAPELVDQTRYTQPALFSLQFALVELWKSWGVTPSAVVGHSLGEYAAACAAGVFDLDAGLRLVAARGQLMGELPADGAMAVVMADVPRVDAACRFAPSTVSIASFNGPETVVISGPRHAILAVVAHLARQGIDTQVLKTSHAGHCELVDPMLSRFRAIAEEIEYTPPRIKMISNLTGDLVTEEVASADYWVQQLRSPVRFLDGMRTLAANGHRTFLEIGPNPNLLAMGMSCVKGCRPRARWLPSLAEDRNDWETMLFSLATLYVDGGHVDWRGFYRDPSVARVSLPTYAFQRESLPCEHHPTEVGTVDEIDVSRLPAPREVANEVDHLQTGLEDESRVLTPRMDEIAIHFVLAALAELGLRWQVGSDFSLETLDARIAARHRPKLHRVLARLRERGWLDQQGRVYRVMRDRPDHDPAVLLDQLRGEAAYPECDLLARAGPAMAAIWQDQVDPLSVLFPAGETGAALEFYRDARLLAGYNRLAATVVCKAAARLAPGDRLRVLEVGAGTGGLTSHLLPQLPAADTEYVFTDVSRHFLSAAEARFGTFGGLRTELLDISRPPAAQGFRLNQFDLVVAANALHATPSLRETLAHVQQLIKPHGWLLLLEGANPPLWGDAVFTLIDGWWAFKDTDLRPDYPLLPRHAWCDLLKQTGFADVVPLHDAELCDHSSNTLLLARSATRCTDPRTAQDLPPNDRSPATVRPDESRDQARDLTTGRGTAAASLQVDQPPDGQSDEDGPINAAGLAALVKQHAARVMRIDPDRIDAHQPLSELGLDSLMATELRAQLSQSLGRDLPLNTLQLRRSAQEIAEYIHDDRAHHGRSTSTSDGAVPGLEPETPRAHLVPLQPNGSKPPLFFVPAGYGDLFAFQDIAHAMGMNQPVLGLQPASAKQVKTFRQMSVHRLVSAYIDQIKRVQPTGPYLLSGYSAGGIIVVELARELIRLGNEIGLLVIFDPPSHVPFWLDWFYQVNYHISVATRLTSVARRFRSRFARRLFHTVLDEGLRTHSAVIREHHVAPYPGRITHFRSRLSQSSLVSLRPMGWFWRRIASEGTEVHWIPGTHYGLLRGRGASVVVDELRDCLSRAEASIQQTQSPATVRRDEDESP